MLLLLWISCVVVDATEKDQACLQQISEMVLYQNLLRYVYLSDCMHNRTFYLETIEGHCISCVGCRNATSPCENDASHYSRL